MAEDFIEEMQAEANLRFGKELSPAECAAKFAAHKFEDRIFHLKNLKAAESMNLGQAAKRHAFERAIRNTHERLRKVDR
jgi:hypothetical protein